MVDEKFSYRIKGICKGKKYLKNLKRVLNHLFHKLYRNNRHHVHHLHQVLGICLLDVLQNRL